MDYKYKRDLKNSFMIIETGFESAGYEKDVLRYNDIDVLVPFHTVEINNVTQVWYDITGLVSLKDYLMQQGITLDILRKVLVYLKIAIDETERFLIDVNHLLIDIDTVYVVKNNNEWKIMLIYYPDTNEQAKIDSILEFFMNNASKDMMDICFELYDLALDGATIDRIIETIDEEKEYEKEDENNAILREDDEKYIVEDSSENMIEESNDGMPSDDEDYIWGRDNNSNFFDEENEKTTLLEKIKNYFSNYFDNKKKDVADKTKGLIPDFGIKKRKKNNRDEMFEDFTYEPDQQIYEPTVLLKNFDKEDTSIDSEGAMLGELQYIGENKKSNIRINKDEFRLGSSIEGNDSVIDSPVISRFHAKIIREGQSYYLEDLNSTNGTSVNGKLLGYRDKVLLNSEDKIMFADECYKIV